VALLSSAANSARARLAQPLLVCVVIVAAGLVTRNAAAQSGADEYQVKAAYILNFARFVEWPVSALPPSSPITVAIVGKDPFDGVLEQVLRGKIINGHPMHLHYARWNEPLTQYQIVFISASEEAHLAEILRSLGNANLLTVSDVDRFSLRGGMIEFCMVGNRVRFDIDRAPAMNSRLTISSKLLSVARAVHEWSAGE
jgi:hypothetical protein